jgi:hypothetical protein
MRRLLVMVRVAGSNSEAMSVENRRGADLLVEISKLTRQVVNDAAGANGMDAGQQNEAAVAVRTGLPRQVGDVTGR